MLYIEFINVMMVCYDNVKKGYESFKREMWFLLILILFINYNMYF